MAGRRAATARGARFPGLARELLEWFDRTKRPLPWRKEPSPYRAWLSEIALQQTRVAQAIPLYERLIARFPDIGSLARASEQEVLKAWEGAGYYARARNLRRAALEITAGSSSPRWPKGSGAWSRLPGIGPYSAHALASRLDGEAVGALDANARRVAVRLSLERGPPTSGQVTRRLQRLLDGLVPRDRPGDFNEAVMELGETVCWPRSPDCPACPVARHCRARRALPDPSVLPRTRRRPLR
ncbi:MAG TPA: A/G-specific adenine glycosylase, partial [Thermoplasmata archaeon]|nr:A/G-specific adenine glycosylase [Thermoplasmata archaeon]